PKLEVSDRSSFSVSEWKQECYDALNDDFNSPELIAKLFEVVRLINAVDSGKEKLTQTDVDELKEAMHSFIFDILGLRVLDTLNDENNQDRERLEGVIELLIDLRKRARDNKDFETSDQIRDELGKLGIQLKDGKKGTDYVL